MYSFMTKLVVTQDIIDNNKRMFVNKYDDHSIKEVTVDELKDMLDDESEMYECRKLNDDYKAHSRDMKLFFVNNKVIKMYHAETLKHGVVDIFIVE